MMNAFLRKIVLPVAVGAVALGFGIEVAIRDREPSDAIALFAVSLPDTQGTPQRLDQWRGKVLVVNFWATWCDPCRAEIPGLIEMQDKYGPKGFTVLGSAMDEEGKPVVAPFIAKERYDVKGQQLPMNYPIVIGNENVASQLGTGIRRARFRSPAHRTEFNQIGPGTNHCSSRCNPGTASLRSSSAR